MDSAPTIRENDYSSLIHEKPVCQFHLIYMFHVLLYIVHISYFTHSFYFYFFHAQLIRVNGTPKWTNLKAEIRYAPL